MITDVTTQEVNPYMRYMTPELAEKARIELREEPERRDRAVKEMRYWLRNHKTIYSKSDDEFILKFLRNTKFDVDKAKKKITKCYEIRNKEQQYGAKNQANFDVIIELLHQKPELGVLMNFAGNYHENILIVNPAVWDYEKYNVQYIATGFVHIAEILLRDPRSMINGFQAVCDCKGLSFGAVLQITPTLIYKFITIFQNCMPVRIKGLHLMNAPTFVNKMIIIGKMFASTKMKNRFHVHEGADFSLCELFPAEALPNEYGGTAGPIQKFTDELEILLLREKEFLLDDEKHGVGRFPKDESSDSGNDSDYIRTE